MASLKTTSCTFAKTTGKAGALDGQDLPILDLSALNELAEELADRDIARHFAENYTAMCRNRIGRLTTSVQEQDHDAILDAAISLKVSSTMVGALRLAQLAATLEGAARNGTLRDGETLLAAIAESGPATVREIRTHYLAGTDAPLTAATATEHPRREGQRHSRIPSHS